MRSNGADARLRCMYAASIGEVEAAESAPEAREADRVLRWRCEQFGRLGFGLRARLVLAMGDADLALARKLIASDCPVATAEQILA